MYTKKHLKDIMFLKKSFILKTIMPKLVQYLIEL